MFLTTTSRRSTVGKFGIACLVVLQAAIPNVIWGQPTQGGGLNAGARSGAAPSMASGFLNSATGPVFMRRGNGLEVEAKVGDVFGPDTIFRTSDEAEAVLLFADGQSITLGKSSVLRIGDYRFDNRDAKSSRATLALASGIMRLVTGAIHTDNRDGLHVSAGNASIGILSRDVTAFVLEVDSKSAGIGAAAVIVGEISLQTVSGTVDSVDADQFTRWQTGFPPDSPLPLDAAPAIFQAMVAASRATVLGSNSPLDIQSAAVQAALDALSATGAGGARGQILQAQAPESAATLIVPTVTPGGGRGCVGSPC